VQFYTFFNLGNRSRGWSTPRPGRFTSGKETRYPFYKTLGGPKGRSGRVRESPHNPGFDPKIVQPVANRYTAPAILAHGDVRINITLWRVRVITVPSKKQNVLHILSLYLYPWLSSKQCACSVLYCPTVFFQNCLINGTIFGKTLFNITCLF